MRMKTVELYAHFALTAPENAAGQLACLWTENHREISPDRRSPAVLILPGGGYGFCSGREAEPIALRFLAKGYAAFILTYSCAPHAFPTALREAAMAMRYIRENAAEFGIDPNMVAATGFSAGGHLCGTLGMMYDCPEVADIGPGALLRPDALGLCYPVAVEWGRTHEGTFRNISGGDQALRQRLSLDRLARPDMPPVYLWHTRNDGAVPCRNSLILACALEEQGVDFAMHIYRDGPHGLSLADEMVYPVWKVPEMSADIPGWVEEEIRFFAERGLKIQDP